MSSARILVLSLVLYAAALAGQEQQPQDEHDVPDYTARTTDRLNVRTGPDTSFKKLTTLRKQAQVTVIAHKGEWCRLKATDVNAAWAHCSYLERLPDEPIYQPSIIERLRKGDEGLRGCVVVVGGILFCIGFAIWTFITVSFASELFGVFNEEVSGCLSTGLAIVTFPSALLTVFLGGYGIEGGQQLRIMFFVLLAANIVFSLYYLYKVTRRLPIEKELREAQAHNRAVDVSVFEEGATKTSELDNPPTVFSSEMKKRRLKKVLENLRLDLQIAKLLKERERQRRQRHE